MPLAQECLYNNRKIAVEIALEIREQYLNYMKTKHPDFRCMECGNPVQAHKASQYGEAHFEYLKRNPKCSLSDSRR